MPLDPPVITAVWSATLDSSRIVSVEGIDPFVIEGRVVESAERG
jgi:hypothetical protein